MQWTTLVTGRYMITMMVLLCYVNLSGGQICTDSVDIEQDGDEQLFYDRLGIFPRLNFTCNGRITNIRAKVTFRSMRSDYFIFQVWRPSSIDQTVYNKIDEVQLQSDDQVTGRGDYRTANIILTGNDTIEFQSGDVIGYYHPPDARYRVRDINTTGYLLYRFDGSPIPNSVNLSESDVVNYNRQPLLQFTIDIQCPTPANGKIISCSSGSLGLGYEGDTCSFTCNTGYELTDNDTRTCQSNGNWSDSDVMCRRIGCQTLTNPGNGMINCSLGDDGVPSYEDTCSFTCNTGYELTGSYTRTCQSDGSWSGRVASCTRVTCEDLDTPSNGSINCSSNNQPLQYQDICTFECDDGYELQGSVIRQCEASGEWSGSRTQCNIRHCPDITTLVPNSRSCDTAYTSTCMVECEDGYNMSGDSSEYSCDLNDTDIEWIFDGSGATCSPVPCASLSDPENGNVTCPSNTSVFQDICTYYCNRGYQLEGNRQTTCTADGTWSSEPVTCTILTCNNPEEEIANSQSVGVCDVTYGSSCSLNCSSGFSASGNGEHVCDDVNDEGTAVKWRSVEGTFSCDAIRSTSTDADSGLSIPTIAGSVGGATLFLIILLLSICVVILCLRHSHKKRSHYSFDTTVTELNSSVNPITKQNKKQENQSDCVIYNKCFLQDSTVHCTVEIQSNPSYGRVQGCNTIADDATVTGHDVTLQPNPSYNTISKETADDEDQDGYVETGTHGVGYLRVLESTSTQKDLVDAKNVKIDPNPSYVPCGVKQEETIKFNTVI